MKQWYAKEFSQLTQISVRTLHHYDKIGLLKPSLRLSNRYRLYSEQDLLKLQQIIALKFFGFELAQIKQLLAHNTEVLEHFSLQAKFLQEKAETLMQASSILKQVTENCGREKSIPWEQIIQLIEVYRMTQQLESSWIKEVFNPKELEQYAQFEANLQSRFNEKEKKQFEDNWFNLVNEIQNNLHNAPQSTIGISLAKQCMTLINNLYGKEHAHLRTTKWEKGFKEGKGLEDHGLTTEIVDWLDRAIDAYWFECIHEVLAKANKMHFAESITAWNELMENICGNSSELRTAVYDKIMHDEHVSSEAKDWLKKISEL
ncbi:MerR family transcriptional regulator [Legionella sp. WA2022007384]